MQIELFVQSCNNNNKHTTPEISGRTFKDIANDSEEVAKIFETMAEEDLSSLKEAFVNGDVKSLDVLVRKEMAATKVLSR